MTEKTSQPTKAMHPLKRHRKASGYTLTAWAKANGVSVTTAWNWENGACEPTADKLPRMAELLGITALQLTELISPSNATAA